MTVAMRFNHRPLLLDLGEKGVYSSYTLQHMLAFDPSARAIVSSGYSNDPVVAKFADYGFKGALSKPFTLALLKEAVESAALSRAIE